MEVTGSGADEVTRLQTVQTVVRTLVRNHGWFGDAIRAASDGFLSLVKHHHRERSALRERERRMARRLLAKGWLCDPEARDKSACLPVRVQGLCPVALAEQLGKYRLGEAMPRELEREGAKLALAALDRDTIYQAHVLPEKKREAMAAKYRASKAANTHVEFAWIVLVSKPEDWEELRDPHALDLLPKASSSLIVPKPTETGDPLWDIPALAAWESAEREAESKPKQPHLERFSEDEYRTIALHRLGELADAKTVSPSRFPPDVAEQMLEVVKKWAKPEAVTRGEPLNEREISVVGSGYNGNTTPKTTLASADESAGPALTANQSQVLQTMAAFDASRLVSADEIETEMDVAVRVSARTIGPILRKLIELGLAERPEGGRSGARLTTAGRRLASKIAD